MFNTSLDILYAALALCAVVLTIFLCAALYQFISSARKINRLAAGAERIAVKVESLVSFLQDRVSHSAAMFLGAAEAVKGIMAIFQSKAEKNKKK